MRRIIIGLVVVVVLAGGGYYIYQSTQTAAEDPAETIDVNNIALNTGVDTVSAEGRVEPLDSANLGFQVGGKLAEIVVAEGEMVEAGQPILRLDDTDQQIALEQAQTAVVQAEANLETAQANLVSAEAGLQASQVGVDAAEAQLALVESGATEAQLALQRTQVNAAQAQVAQAAGQQAATLEGPTTAEVQAAQARLQAAQAELVPVEIKVTQYRNGTIEASQDEEQQVELEYQAALARVEAARSALAQVRSGATTSEQLSVNSAVAAAANSRNAAESELDLTLAGARDEEITVAEVGVEQAQNAVTEAELNVAQAEAGVVQAETAVAEAQSSVEAAESAVRKTILLAPFSGTIADISAKVDETVTAGAPVVRLADFEGWQVKTTDLTELGVVNVAVGYPTEVELDAFPNQTLRGEVVDIATSSDLVLGDVTYEVTVQLGRTALPLRWGMTAFVTVDVDQ